MGVDAWRSRVDIRDAARRLEGVVERTPLAPFSAKPGTLDLPVELRLKLECLQQTGSFKARGAWNHVSQLSEAERGAGVVAASSGNHGQAVAWAALRAGVAATICMPGNTYPNKVERCRELGAEVVLCETREACDEACAERARAGAVPIHPYDAERTIEGAGTVGLEIAEDWPEVEVVVVPVGGGGLISGCALALRLALGSAVSVIGVEPAGAPSLVLSLERGEAVTLERISTEVQGLCPVSTGARNFDVCRDGVSRVIALPDEVIFAAQRRLVNDGGLVVEPAGAAAFALLDGGAFPAPLLEGRTHEDPLRVAVVVSGGNPDPAQLEAIRGAV